MKQLLIITLLLTTLSLNSNAQANATTVPGKSSGIGPASQIVPNIDTVDASKAKIIKIDGLLFSVPGVKQSKYFLSDAQLQVLLDRLISLPYVEVASALEIIKQFFGLTPPQK